MSAANSSGLRAFLRHPRPQGPAHVVLGNEASDLDSVASAIGYAYLKPTTPPSTPIVNIPRSHLHLRRDVLHALTLANITSEDLTFIDSMPSPSTLTLVDHNSLASHQSDCAEYVTAIIDHHKDEELFLDAQPRTIAPVGSCATLVSELGEADLDTARLLLCAILIDCGNMVPGGKGTPRDAAAVERLSRIAKWDERERGLIYSKLKAARRDISGFSVVDLLRKDMKVVEGGGKRVAVCTVGISAFDLAGRGERLNEAINAFRGELGVNCVIVMNSYSGSDGHQRDMCILQNELGEAIAKSMPNEHVLQLTKMRIDGAEGLECFRQGNAKASRKIVAPILKATLGVLKAVLH